MSDSPPRERDFWAPPVLLARACRKVCACGRDFAAPTGLEMECSEECARGYGPRSQPEPTFTRKRRGPCLKCGKPTEQAVKSGTPEPIFCPKCVGGEGRRICILCLFSQPEEDFYPTKGGSRNRVCKPCKGILTKARRDALKNGEDAAAAYAAAQEKIKAAAAKGEGVVE